MYTAGGPGVAAMGLWDGGNAWLVSACLSHLRPGKSTQSAAGMGSMIVNFHAPSIPSRSGADVSDRLRLSCFPRVALAAPRSLSLPHTLRSVK